MESSQNASRQQRAARSCPGTKVDFQFVSVKPDDQDQRIETRAIVRANAAHFHWRNNRPPREKSRSETSRRGAISRHSERVSPLKSIQLGTDVDPFASYSCDLPRAFISHCIAFNAEVILPALFPGGADNFNVRASLIQISSSHPGVLHMFITGALVNAQGTLGIPSNSLALGMFRSRAEIVRRMSIVMQDPVEACKDVNIFAIVALGKIEMSHRTDVEVQLKTPKQGPLRSLQLLNVLALSETDPIHLDGLSRLIKLKGGLDMIEIPGLAALISLGGLLVATRDCTAPRFAAVTLSCPTREFIFQGRGMGFGTDQDLYVVLSMLNGYTMMIDGFCEGRNVVTASVLIDHRNATQHALLSLLPRTGRFECYRLAALIYSLLVTFPLPYSVAPFERLVTRLKTALIEWNGDDQMLVWVLAMGAIGATGLEERGWFVKSFREAVARIGCSSWAEARDIIRMGLWYEATNDGDGKDLWLESQNG